MTSDIVIWFSLMLCLAIDFFFVHFSNKKKKNGKKPPMRIYLFYTIKESTSKMGTVRK